MSFSMRLARFYDKTIFLLAVLLFFVAMVVSFFKGAWVFSVIFLALIVMCTGVLSSRANENPRRLAILKEVQLSLGGEIVDKEMDTDETMKAYSVMGRLDGKYDGKKFSVEALVPKYSWGEKGIWRVSMEFKTKFEFEAKRHWRAEAPGVVTGSERHGDLYIHGFRLDEAKAFISKNKKEIDEILNLDLRPAYSSCSVLKVEKDRLIFETFANFDATKIRRVFELAVQISRQK